MPITARPDTRAHAARLSPYLGGRSDGEHKGRHCGAAEVQQTTLAVKGEDTGVRTDTGLGSGYSPERISPSQT